LPQELTQTRKAFSLDVQAGPLISGERASRRLRVEIRRRGRLSLRLQHPLNGIFLIRQHLLHPLDIGLGLIILDLDLCRWNVDLDAPDAGQ
jgi:hypothetical protein